METPKKPIPLDYATPEPSRQGCLAVLGSVLGLGAVVFWALFELQRMPYRPPVDMSTLLGGQEIADVRFLMWVVALLWIVSLVWFIHLIKSKR